MPKTHPIHHNDGSPEHRYTLRQECCGQPKPCWVARFCGEWIGQSRFYSSALMLLVGYKARRNGAPIITEKTA